MVKERFENFPRGDIRADKRSFDIDRTDDTFVGSEKRCKYLYKVARRNKLTLDEQTKILDVGSGNAQFLKELEERGLRPVGIDALPRGRGEGLQIRGRIEQLPFADESFDVVMSALVFDASIYYQNQTEMFEEIVRVLKTGGLYIAMEPFTHLTPNGLKLIEEDWHKKEKVYKKIET